MNHRKWLVLIIMLIPFIGSQATNVNVYFTNVDGNGVGLGGTLSVYNSNGTTAVSTDIASGEYEVLTQYQNYQERTDNQIISTRMHHDWNDENLDCKIKNDFTASDPDQEEEAVFYPYSNVTFNLSSNVDNVEDWLELRDPWWVEDAGSVYQPNAFRTFSEMGISTTHKVFEDQEVLVTNQYYSIKAPQLVADENGIYEFSNLAFSGATSSADPDHPSDSRYKGIEITSSIVNITATYTQVNTQSGSYGVPSDDKLVIPSGAEIECNSGFGLYIYGELEAIGTAESPIVLEGTSSNSYWNGVHVYSCIDMQYVTLKNLGVSSWETGSGLYFSYLADNEANLDHCTIINSEVFHGWANFNLTINNCTFYNSDLSLANIILGGTRSAIDYYTVVCKNNIFYSPTSGIINMEYVSSLTEEYNCYDVNDINITISTNSITDDPDFNDAANGDFTLESTSPCIDAGDPGTADDPDGTTADMGAYYYDAVPSAPQSLSYTTNAYDNPVLSWTASSDADIDKYRIYRGSDDLREPMTQIGTTTSTSYTDHYFWVAPVEEYQYYVKAEDNIGQLSGASNEINVDGYAAKQLVEMLPQKFDLHENYPNPFNPSTTIKYDLPEASMVSMKVYDFLGREIRTLVNESISAGYNHVVWDGRNDFGKSVASGIYLLTVDIKGIDSGEQHNSKMKLILIK